MSAQNFIIDGEPVSAKNSQQIRHNRHGRPFIAKSDAAAEWQLNAIGQLSVQRTRGRLATIRGDCAVSFTAYQRQKRDIDNIASALFDALKKAKVIGDDMDITKIKDAEKITDPECEPRIEVTVTPLPVTNT